MCRWFAYVSENEECLLEDVLVTPKHSLSKQVHDHYLPKLLHHDPDDMTTEKEIDARNRLFNIDGLGVAWYTNAKSDFIQNLSGTRPALYKTIQPPLNDINFRSIAANTSTKCCFAHIRAASATGIVSLNNHPFVFGRHALMHNGVVSDFLAIRRQLSEKLDADAYANVLGSTDSEHVAALYITVLTQGKGKSAWEQTYSTHEMAKAMHEAVKTVVELQKQVLGTKAQPNSLNIAATDGQKLVAYRFRNHATEQPPSLYYSTNAGVTLNRKYPDHPDGIDTGRAPERLRRAEDHGRHVIVASEPSTYNKNEWELIDKNNCLLVESNGDVHVGKAPYDEAWNTEENADDTTSGWKG